MSAVPTWLAGRQGHIAPEPAPIPAIVVFLPRREVIRRVGLSKSTIYARIANKSFPEPVHDLETGTVWWLEHEIDAWQRKRISASRASSMGTCMGTKEEGPAN